MLLLALINQMTSDDLTITVLLLWLAHIVRELQKWLTTY